MASRRLLGWLLLASVSLAGMATPAGAASPLELDLPSDEAPAIDREVPVPEPGPDPEVDVDARVLVLPVADVAEVERAADRHDADVVGEVAGTGYLVVSADGDAETLADRLEGEPGVAEAVVDHRRALFTTSPVTPNDPMWKHQESMRRLTRVDEAWSFTTGSSDVIVAVIDTGVDRTHPDLTGRVLAGRDLVAGGSRPPDPHGHGTAVAGIIAAKGNDKVGIAGVAWKSRILPVRVLDEHGWGWDSDIAAGIVWAADQGASVINLSLGGPDPSPALEAAVAHAAKQGAVVVAAAGNDGTDEPMYPAATPGVLAVGATDDGGNLTDFSSYGTWVDVTAPGFAVMTTLPTADADVPYGRVSGTSIAAPFVSGAAALMLARYPTRTPSQVARNLRATARDAGPPGIDVYHGWGIVDVAYAVGGWKGDPLPAVERDRWDPNDLPARATPLPEDVYLDAHIAPEGDEDWYRFDLTEPRSVTVRVQGPYRHRSHATSMDPIVALLDEQLRVVDVDAAWAGGSPRVSAVLPAGRGYVYVANLGPSVSNGGYNVRLTTAGAPPLEASKSLATGVGTPEGLAIADVTGDGVEDLLMASRGTNRGLFVLSGLAGGGFAEPIKHTIANVEALGGGVATLDLDGDGDLDVVVATTSGLQAFHQVDGALVPADGPPLPAVSRPMLVAAGDVTGDGSEDLVYTLFGAGTWVATAGEDGWTAVRIADRYRDLEVVDLDGDGVAAVVAITSTPFLHVHRFVDEEWTHLSWPTLATGSQGDPQALAIMHADGDGLVDVAVTVGQEETSSNVQVLRQQEDGSFQVGTPRAVRQNPQVLAAGDVDGDGHADAVTFHRSLSVASLVPGDGSGGFRVPRQVSTVTGSADFNRHGTLLHDVDGDGDLDVVTGTGGTLRWLRNGPVPSTEPADVWVRNISPAPFSRSASPSPTITIDVTRDLDPASVTSTSVLLRDGRTGQVVATTRSYDASKRRIVLTPTAPLLGGSPYRVDIGALVDQAGEVSDDHYQLPFVVAKDKVKPAPVTGLKATSTVEAVELRWVNPTDVDLDHIEVRNSHTDRYGGPKDGLVLYRGTATRTTIPAEYLDDGYLSVFAIDRSGNASARAGVRVQRTMLTGANNATITHGAKVTLTGELWNAIAGGRISGLDVDLLHRPAGTSEWTRLATATTAKDGTVSFGRRPTTTAAYRLRFRGTSAYAGSEQTIGTVKVRSAVTAKLAATSVKPKAIVRLSGAVAPAKPGAVVVVQRRRSDGTWAQVGTAKVRSDGTYRFDLTAGSKGAHRYRVRVPADTGNLMGTSPTVTLTVN